jgi:signal transduction histidine kinase
MVTALQLISPRVVAGRASDKLPDVAGHLARIGTHHLVVLNETTGGFLGVVRLTDIAWRANASTRVLADLVSSVQPIIVGPGESAAAVCALFVQHRLGEAAVVDANGRYLGLITNESVLEWNCAELKRTQNLLRLEEETLQSVQAGIKVAAAEREQYLASLSHILRSPLNPVMLIATSRAESRDLPEDIRRDFRTIAQNIAQETKAIDDLIDAARRSRTRPPVGP